MLSDQEAGMAVNVSPEHQMDAAARVDTCEVVVVGAGLVGAAVVANLAAEGLDIAVLEARDVTGGATGHAAGMVLTGLPMPYAEAIAKGSRETARDLWSLTVDGRIGLVSTAERLGVDVQRTGSLVLAANAEEAAILRTSAALLRDDGFNVQFRETDPLDRGFAGALYYSDAVVVDTVSLTQRIFEFDNVSVHTNTEVYGLVQDGDNVRVLARGRTVKASTVVLAVNAYAPLVHSYFANKVAPVRGYTFITEPMEEGTIPTPASCGPFYFRQTADGRLVFAAWPKTYEAPAAGPRDHSAEIDLMRFAGLHFPTAAKKFVQRESSVMGISRDGLPLIGALPDLPQVFFAVGFANSGLNLAFAAAEMLVGLIDRGAEPRMLRAKRLE
jgi:glycine/D-amino acid oxidase-like deaminating enzyme